MLLQDKPHTTNYFNALIEVANDCKVLAGLVPVIKNDKKIIASMRFDLLSKHPYKYTADDIFLNLCRPKRFDRKRI